SLERLALQGARARHQRAAHERHREERGGLALDHQQILLYRDLFSAREALLQRELLALPVDHGEDAALHELQARASRAWSRTHSQPPGSAAGARRTTRHRS